MASSGQLTTPALQALLQDGTLAGSWTLDPARSEVHLKSRHTWGLRGLSGIFGEVTGHGTVSAAGGNVAVIEVLLLPVNLPAGTCQVPTWIPATPGPFPVSKPDPVI